MIQRHLKCPDCIAPKPESEFYRNRSRRSGRQPHCKEHESIRKHQTDVYRDRHNKWARLNRAKVNAHGAVRRALKSGRLSKPKHCDNCGEEKKLNAHHDDYDQRLVVRWLCTVCHYAVHHPQEVMA